MYKFNERKKTNRIKNIGNFDAILRVIAGSLILVTGLVFENWWGLTGLYFIVTGGLSFCPIYKIFGIHTAEIDVEQVV